MKAKKSISVILLALILLLSSFVLFACGGKDSSKSTFESYNSFMTQIKQDTSLFSTKEIENYYTKFYLNDLYSKNSSGTPTYENNYYIALGAVSLEFIDEYYPKLETLKLKTDYSKLKDDIKSLNKSYNNLKVEHENLKNDAQNLDYTIYNGYFSRYRTYAQKFINKSYQSALKLGKFLNNEAKLAKTVATQNMTDEAFEFFCDYTILNVYNDFNNFFMSSCKGVALESEVFNDVLYSLKNFTNSFVLHKSYSVTTEKAKEAKEIITRVNNERGMVNKAVSKFSVYKYSKTYNQSIDAYIKANANAPAYLNKINMYYADANGTINQLRVYLLSL